MNTERLKRLIRLIGPYPYNPYLLFLFFFSFYFSRYIRVVAYLPAGAERWKAGGLVLLASAIPAIVFALGAMLLTRFRFWSAKSTIFYILEVAFFQYLNLLYLPFINRFLQVNLGYFDKTILALSKNIFVASLLLVLVALALMHQAERKISDRLDLATNLVGKLEKEREGLIQSDERLRRHASQFLHDRVQSDLMVVGMKLKSISGQASPEVNEVIDRVIQRLESTRATDLKSLIQTLTPNLDAGSLRSALDTLLERYQSNMAVSLQIDAATEKLDSRVLLGVFRIVEQSMLNTLVHGPANRVQISITTNSEYVTDIIVSDDGPGSTVEAAIAGVGTTIIDSWVGILNGSKVINSAPGHGYQLHISFTAD